MNDVMLIILKTVNSIFFVSSTSDNPGIRAGVHLSFIKLFTIIEFLNE